MINSPIAHMFDRGMSQSACWCTDTLRTKRNMRDILRGTLASGDVYIGGMVWHDDGNRRTSPGIQGKDIITPYNLYTPLACPWYARHGEKRARNIEEERMTHGWTFAGIAIPFFSVCIFALLCKDIPNARKVRILRPAAEE